MKLMTAVKSLIIQALGFGKYIFIVGVDQMSIGQMLFYQKMWKFKLEQFIFCGKKKGIFVGTIKKRNLELKAAF